MVRNYKRKTDSGNKNFNEKFQYTVHLMTADNFSLKEAGVDKSALSRFCKRKHIGNIAPCPVFGAVSEVKLTKCLIATAHMNHRLTMEEARRLAYTFASAKNISVLQSWNENKMTGKNWSLKFMEQNPALTLRKLEATSLARSTASNKHTVGKFFENLKDIHGKKNFTANRIYNIDETGLTTVHVPPKVIAPSAMKQVGQVTSGERGILDTLVCCISADGISIQPKFIWPHKTEPNLETYMTKSLPGSVGLVHENGWMTTFNFNKWMAHFISFSKPSRVTSVVDFG
ncbi:uncharacterized protein [Watersipora subatra]|uniref:uncharacterized protein n=1 Tax=Watersipora subatra TaxID=2589382 RepID=UPI00355AD43E